MNPRLTKAVNGLRETAEWYEHQDWFEFSDDHVMIKPPADKPYWMWLYIVFLIVAPAVGAIFFLIKGDPGDFNTMLILFVAAIGFGVLFRNWQRGTQTIKVDFTNKQFVFEPLYKPVMGKKGFTQVPFTQVGSIQLKHLQFPNRVKVLRLFFNDQDDTTLSYVDFEPKHYALADKIRRFADVVLKL